MDDRKKLNSSKVTLAELKVGAQTGREIWYEDEWCIWMSIEAHSSSPGGKLPNTITHYSY